MGLALFSRLIRFFFNSHLLLLFRLKLPRTHFFFYFSLPRALWRFASEVSQWFPFLFNLFFSIFSYISNQLTFFNCNLFLPNFRFQSCLFIHILFFTSLRVFIIILLSSGSWILLEIAIRDNDFDLMGLVVTLLNVIIGNFNEYFHIVSISSLGFEYIDDISTFFWFAAKVLHLSFEVLKVGRSH